jgi:hypothetical protein
MEELMAADARLDFYSKEKMEDVKKNVDIVIGRHS